MVERAQQKQTGQVGRSGCDSVVPVRRFRSSRGRRRRAHLPCSHHRQLRLRAFSWVLVGLEYSDTSWSARA